MDFGFLSESVGKMVRMERGGPEKLEGTLRCIMPDCLAIETKNEGVVYVQSQHIKTISENVVPEVEMTVPETAADPNAPAVVEQQMPLIEAENFSALLQNLKLRLIRVNHGGPNSLQGVLVDVQPDSITILHDMKDYVHYCIYHIRSITVIYETARNKSDQGNDKAANDKAAGGGKGK